MKRRTIIFFSLLSFVFVHLSCSKDDEKDAVPVIDEKNLSACPTNATCEYRFTEKADVNPGPRIFTSGDYRVFWSTVTYQGTSAALYIKAPMAGNSFNLKTSEILNGKVEISRQCATCLFVATKLVGGYVKGINLSPGKAADQTKWILEAQLISEAVAGPSPVRDTLYVKQYFYPNFIYN